MLGMSAARKLVTGASVLALTFAGTVLLSSPAAAASWTAINEAQLVTAINTANGNSGPDTIILGAPITLTADLPAITDSIEIVGAGHTINGAGFAVFTDTGATPIIDVALTDVTITNADPAVDLTFSNATLADSAFDNAPVELRGSGVTHSVSNSSFDNASGSSGLIINIWNSATATVVGSSASGNNGRGIYTQVDSGSSATIDNSGADGNQGQAGFEIQATNLATVTVTNSIAANNDQNGFYVDTRLGATSTLSNNTATGNGSAGFAAMAYDAGSSISLSSSTATANHNGYFLFAESSAVVQGNHLVGTASLTHGIGVTTQLSGTVSISNSTFTDSVAGWGALLTPETGSSITLDRTTVTRNGSGGIFLNNLSSTGPHSVVTITDTTIADNSGRGLSIDSVSFTDTVVERTTISGNTGAQDGGGIYAELQDASSLTLINSTVSGNEHTRNGAVTVADLSSGDGTLSILHSTIANNTGDNTATLGGVSIARVQYDIQHSVIAGNTIGGSASDLSLASGSNAPTGTIDYSLVQAPNADADTALDAGTGNLKNVDARLGPLADNGGLTLTHLPLQTSPAINAGNPAIVGAPSTDQRGQARIVGTIDMGAVEISAALAATGVDAAPFLIGGASLLALGLVLLVARRRYLTR